jgi:hypothetical protein
VERDVVAVEDMAKLSDGRPGDARSGSGRRPRLLGDDVEQIVPTLHERRRAVPLERGPDLGEIDTGPRHGRERFLGVAAPRGDDAPRLAMVGEGQESLLWQRVDRVRCGEGVDVERGRERRILRAGAREEQPLRQRAEVRQPLPAVGGEQIAVGAVTLATDRDADVVGQMLRELRRGGTVPAADEERRHRADPRGQPRLDPPLDATQPRLGRGEVVLAGEEERDVDRHAGERRLLDRRQPLGGARDLDEKIGPAGALVEGDGRVERAAGVVGERGRHLERDPAVHAAGAVEHGPEEIGGPHEILDGQFEEEFLARDAAPHLLGDGVVVGGRAVQRLVEDRRVARETGEAELVDHAGERAVVEHRAGDRVEPEALAEPVQGERAGGHEERLRARPDGRGQKAGSGTPGATRRNHAHPAAVDRRRTIAAHPSGCTRGDRAFSSSVQPRITLACESPLLRTILTEFSWTPRNPVTSVWSASR